MGKPTHYQRQVNSLTGALGPSSSAFWKNTFSLHGPAYSLGAQPLYYAPEQGVYITAADVPAANGSVNFSNFATKKGFGRRKSKRSKKRSKRRVSRKRSKRSKRKY